MKINQVEELVGITKKNIRFYEDQGLIKPDRDPENSYREYSMRDVQKLLRGAGYFWRVLSSNHESRANFLLKRSKFLLDRRRGYSKGNRFKL